MSERAWNIDKLGTTDEEHGATLEKFDNHLTDREAAVGLPNKVAVLLLREIRDEQKRQTGILREIAGSLAARVRQGEAPADPAPEKEPAEKPKKAARKARAKKVEKGA